MRTKAEESEKICVPGKMGAANSREKQRAQDYTKSAGRRGGREMSAQSSGNADCEAGDDQDEFDCPQRGQARGCGEQ
jgi:hypothetical protein